MSLLLPPSGGDARQVATAVNQALKGKINSSGTVVLAANAGSTVVTNQFVGKDSVILLMPQSQNAAADSLDNATYIDPSNYVEGVSFTIAHANNSKGDRVFGYIILGSGSPFIDPATAALIAQMTAPPIADRIIVIDNAVRALKAAALWSKMGLFYVLAAHDQQAARLNWLNPGTATLTAVNSPGFTTDRGFAGDGATSYLDTGVAHNAIGNYSQNSAHAGAWIGAAATNNEVGLNGAAHLILRNSAIRINSTSSALVTSNNLVGHVVGVRRDSANQYGYKNGGGETTNAIASMALVGNTVTIGKAGSAFSAGQVAAVHLGDQLSAGEVASLYGILRAYLSAIGAA